MSEVKSLLEKVKVGPLTLQNRIVMAPMTRGRSDPKTYVVNKSAAKYYSTRANVGLIITEATPVSRQGHGWYGAPGIWNKDHVEGWSSVTKAVHDKGGLIFLQLWHMGRVVHSLLSEDGKTQPVGPSAITAKGEAYTPEGKKPYEEPRALEIKEIEGIVKDFANATKLAKQAGFDGVEIHSANGYLLDQFLRDGSNKRDDKYGGTIENRTRFTLEIVDACVNAWSADRVGIRFSPTGSFNDMKDSDPEALFAYVAKQLNKYKLAFVHIAEPTDKNHMMYVDIPAVTPAFRKAYEGTLILNGGITPESAVTIVGEKQADLVAIGVPLLSTPDYIQRLQKHGFKLTPNAPDYSTLYMGGEEGYNNYPTEDEVKSDDKDDKKE